MAELPPRAIVTSIENLRKLQGTPVRVIAQAASMSEARWRQIVKGYQQVTKDVRAPANAPDETVARMAIAVGMRPSDAEKLGEPTVAALLREHHDLTASAATSPAPTVEGDLSAVTDDDLLEELARRLRSASAAAGSVTGSVTELPRAQVPPVGVAADDPGVPSRGQQIEDFYSGLGEESQE